MSSLRFENELKQLMKVGVSYEMAVIIASSKLEDKTIFNNAMNEINEENKIIEEELQSRGFQPSHLTENYTLDIIYHDEPNNQIKDIQHRESELPEEQRIEE